ncbi:MAG TPA: hypothetical protein VHS96_18450, partial [Bacteroidia bacterium]|nr:hypothetical protein [Bacteroidia bacterium]
MSAVSRIKHNVIQSILSICVVLCINISFSASFRLSAANDFGGGLATKVAGETVTADSILGGPFCAGQQVNVSFSITGTFLTGNEFTAELSDASGSFANPTVIGSLMGTLAGTVVATLPLGQGNGSGYRIRVNASNPSTIGTSNPNDFTIYELPATPVITPSGPTQFCNGNSVTLTSSNAQYNVWSPNGETTTAITVSTGGTYSVIGDNNGCMSDPSDPITVTISPTPPTPVITALGP